MKKTKENNGVALVTLTVTIIVLLIISGIAVYSGTHNIDKTRDQLLLTELEQVKHFVGEKYLDYMKVKSAKLLVGTKLNSSEIDLLQQNLGVTFISIPNTYSEDERAYYRLTPENLIKIGIENCENTYVVNYISGEVINETKLKTSTGQTLYTYLRKNFNNNDVTAF